MQRGAGRDPDVVDDGGRVGGPRIGSVPTKVTAVAPRLRASVGVVGRAWRAAPLGLPHPGGLARPPATRAPGRPIRRPGAGADGRRWRRPADGPSSSQGRRPRRSGIRVREVRRRDATARPGSGRWFPVSPAGREGFRGAAGLARGTTAAPSSPRPVSRTDWRTWPGTSGCSRRRLACARGGLAGRRRWLPVPCGGLAGGDRRRPGGRGAAMSPDVAGVVVAGGDAFEGAPGRGLRRRGPGGHRLPVRGGRALRRRGALRRWRVSWRRGPRRVVAALAARTPPWPRPRPRRSLRPSSRISGWTAP